MSYLDKFKLASIVAAIGFNDGANKGFWRIQPRVPKRREGAGQWIEMGAEIRALLKINGKVQSVVGRSVGSDGTPDAVRVLFQGLGDKGIPDGIVVVPTRFLELVSAVIPEEALKKQGIKTPDSFEPLDIAGEIPNYEDLERTDVTPEDIRVANEGINSPEGKEQAAFKNSPEGKAIEAAENGASDPLTEVGLAPLPSSDPDFQEYKETEADNDEPAAQVVKDPKTGEYEATNYLTGMISPKFKSKSEAEQWLADDRSGKNAKAEKDAQDSARAQKDAEEIAANRVEKLSREEFEAEVNRKIYGEAGDEPKDGPQAAPDKEQLDWAYQDYVSYFDEEEKDNGYVHQDVSGDIFDMAVEELLTDPFDDFDAAMADLWNAELYGEGADLEKVLDGMALPSDVPFGIEPQTAQKSYPLDLHDGDFFFDPKTEDLLQVTGEPEWNESLTNIRIPAVDSTGADRTIEYDNDTQGISKVIDYKTASAKATPSKSPEPIEDAAPSTNSPKMPDTAIPVETKDVKVGDELYGPTGLYVGKVDAVSKQTKDALNKPVIPLTYTDEMGKTYRNVPYALNSKFNAVRTADVTPEAPAAPKAVEAPAAPPAPEVPTAPAAKIAPEDMTMSQLIGDVKSRLDKADASKGANPDYYTEARAALNNPDLTDAQKLSEFARILRTTPLGNGGGTQRETTRQIVKNLDRAGVYEASDAYVEELRKAKTAPAAPAAPAPAAPPAGPPAGPGAGGGTPPPLLPWNPKTDAEITALRNTALAPLIDEDGNAVVQIVNGKAVNPADTNALMNLLAESYPGSYPVNAGRRVLIKDVIKGTDKAGNPKNFTVELSAAITGNKKIAYVLKFEDDQTGAVRELQIGDLRDSVTSLFTRSNSPEGIMEILTGARSVISGSFKSAKQTNALDRARYFTYGKTGGNKARPSVEQAITRVNGIQERQNNSSKNRTLLSTEVRPVWHYLDNKDGEFTEEERLQGIYDSLAGAFGEVPIDAQLHGQVRRAILSEFKIKYPGENIRPFTGFVTSASNKYLKQDFDNNGSRRGIPYSSKDRVTPITAGMVVEYEGTSGSTKSVVTVLRRKKVSKARIKNADGSSEYGDYVIVQDSNGNIGEYPTTNLRILRDQKTPLTPLSRRLSGPEMNAFRAKRAQELKARYDSTYKYIEPGSPEDLGGVVDDLVPGSNLYGKGANPKLLGQVVEMTPVIGKDGKSGYEIIFEDPNGKLRKIAVSSGEFRGIKK